jgi:hypothetical protein
VLREKTNADGICQPRSVFALYVLFGIVAPALGAAMSTVRHSAISRIESARQWEPTPAVVERGFRWR